MAKQRSTGSKRKLPAAIARHGRWIFLLLACVYALGVWVRAEDYPQWKHNRALFFHEGEPILSSGDGYYYLRYARDLAEGVYQPVDAMRRVPDRPPRPSPPPLLSALTAAVHTVTRIPLARVAVLLAPLLAPLLLVPVYLIARASGGGVAMGLSAALVSVVSEYYVGRTRVGVFDTDCLIVTLTLVVCWCMWRFALERSRRRYAWAAGALVAYALFCWWWDTATMVASAICLAMFAVAVTFFYRARAREALVFAAGCAVVLVAVLLWRGFDAPLAFVRGVAGMLAFVGGDAVEGPFPSTVGNIRELQVLPFAVMARFVAANAVFFLAGAAGFLWWLWSLKKRALLLAVPAALAVIPMVFGNRFLIFQTPAIALGLGYLVERGWRMRARWGAVATAAPLVAIVPAAILYSHATAGLYRSPMARSMDAITAVEHNTPDNATVWSTFWHGYPVLYYARRAVITDAGTLEGRRLVYQNIPFASSSPRLSANFMQFWIARGSDGMQALYDACGGDPGRGLRLLRDVLSAGPDDGRALIAGAITSGTLTPDDERRRDDDWLRFFFPPRRSPMYLLLTADLTDATDWFTRGTWDPDTRSGTRALYRPYFGLRRVDDTVEGSRSLRVDLSTGTLRAIEPDGTRTALHVSRIVTATAGGLDADDLGGNTGVDFEWVPERRYGAAMTDAIAESTFNRLFIRHHPDKRYFRAVALQTPSFQLWEVRGDGL